MYNQFDIVVNLTQQMRQENESNDPKQAHFIELLNRTRTGSNTIEDWNLLCERVITPLNEQEFVNAQRLFVLNEDVDNYNYDKLKSLDSPIAKILAKNNEKSIKLPKDQFNGAPNRIYLSVGAKITITTNLWQKFGIVNGIEGVVRDIIYPPNRTNDQIDIPPTAVLIEFDHYQGPQFFSDTARHNWLPINMYDYFNKWRKCTRSQFPIRLNYAMTIHKSQGATMNQAVINLGDSESHLGVTYVALSRLKNIKDLLLFPLTYDRLEKIGRSKGMLGRLKEADRINKLAQQTIENNTDLYNN